MSEAPQRRTFFLNPKPLNRSERVVLAHIAMYCDENRRLVQSLRQIADATFLSHVSVHDAIDRLNELQLIRTYGGSPVRTSEHTFLKWDPGRSERVRSNAPASGRSPRVRIKTAVAGGAR